MRRAAALLPRNGGGRALEALRGVMENTGIRRALAMEPGTAALAQELTQGFFMEYG